LQRYNVEEVVGGIPSDAKLEKAVEVGLHKLNAG
jgi:hypothetical protein